MYSPIFLSKTSSLKSLLILFLSKSEFTFHLDSTRSFILESSIELSLNTLKNSLKNKGPIFFPTLILPIFSSNLLLLIASIIFSAMSLPLMISF